MAKYLSSAPDPISLTSDEHFETRSVLVCFLIFFFCIISCHWVRGFPPYHKSQEDLLLLIFFGGAFGKCISGSNSPAIWQNSRLDLEISAFCLWNFD